MFFSVFTLIIILFESNSVNSATVPTQNGELSGTTYETVGGRIVFAFLGVPFAKPPVDNLRFKEPQPIQNWKGIRPARNFSPKCIQFEYYKKFNPIVGEEDCLYLNVFTPNISRDAKLDVIVYIHGGAFMFGSGDMFKPDYILDRTDLVFVSINYRLGPFGFMTTEDGVIPGNIGLKDQVSALWWVQKNIEYFGGDKDKVTLAGLSAGGASVHLHYYSPLSKSLFKQGISMSGTAFCPWVLAENAREKAHILAKSIGCYFEDSKRLLECLNLRKAEKILLQLDRLFMPWFYNPFSPFGAVIEEDSDSAFLSKHPWQLSAKKDVKNAPWLASATTEEGLYPGASFAVDKEKLQELDKNWESIAPFLLDYDLTVEDFMQNLTSRAIRQSYFQKKKISVETSGELIRMIGDRLFLVDIERAVRQQSRTASPVYFYSFKYRGKHSISDTLCHCNKNLGASHGDDLFYVVKCDFNVDPTETEEDRRMIDTMVEIWTSFVKNGKPSTLLNETWPSVNEATNSTLGISYMLISSPSDIKHKRGKNLGDNQFWDELHFDELWGYKPKKPRFEDEL